MTKPTNKSKNIKEKTTMAKQQSQESTDKKTTVAKAGKRSAKAIDLGKQLEAKKARKDIQVLEKKSESTKPRQKDLTKIHSKMYRKAKELVDENPQYDLDEAIKLIKKVAEVKFDSTIEVHVNLGIDPKQADQNIRGSIILPKSLGKKVRIAVLANEKMSTKLKESGANYFDSDEILTKLAKSKIDFDVLISTPDQMVKLGKFAKILGPKGLMPSPKSGTVTDDPLKIVREIKAGRTEFRNDSYGIIHFAVGKKSFSDKDLLANINKLFISIKNLKPNSLKGTFIKSIYLTSTMSPSVKVDLASVLKTN